MYEDKHKAICVKVHNMSSADVLFERLSRDFSGGISNDGCAHVENALCFVKLAMSCEYISMKDVIPIFEFTLIFTRVSY